MNRYPHRIAAAGLFAGVVLGTAACSSPPRVLPQTADGTLAPDQERLLNMAARGHRSAVSDLLARGADINQKDAQGRTPLHLAAANGHEELVAFLIGRGAALDAQDQNGFTALHLASAGGHGDITRDLLAAGANRDLRTEDGRTAAQMKN